MGTNVSGSDSEIHSPGQTDKRPGRLAQPHFRNIVIGAVAIILLAVAGLWYYYHGRVTTDDAQVDGHITPIACKVYGTIRQVLVEDNEHVKAGQVLLRIDPRDYEAKVAQAEAALKLAEAQAEAARVNVPLTFGTTESAIQAAKAAVTAARAQFDRAHLAYVTDSTAGISYAQAQVSKREAENAKAQADWKRMKPLMQKAEISQLQYDAYLAAAQSANSDLRAARERLTEARRRVAVDRAEMVAAQAQVSVAQANLREAEANRGQVPMRTAESHSASANVLAAEANLDAAKLQLSYTTVVAPTEGVVTKKEVEPGQIVQPGQELFAVIPLNTVFIRANFKETQLANVHPGERAEIHVDMYGKTFPGYVESISGATGARMSLLPPENATGNFVKVVQRIPIRIFLKPVPTGKNTLRPGMNVEATIFTR